MDPTPFDLSFDVVVVGAGPAGSSLAWRLARGGLSVLILEGKPFPRPHIGESLLAMSMPYLDEMGVTAALVDSGFVRKTGAIFVWGDIHRHLPMTSPGHAFQVLRDRFDDILMREARSAGVTVWTGCWAGGLVRDPTGRIVGIFAHGERSITVGCRMLADASGLSRFVPRRLGLPSCLSGPPRAAIVMYAEGAGRYSDPFGGDIVTEAAADGWVWFIPLSDTLTSVGFVCDRADVLAEPARVLTEQINTTRVVRGLMEPATTARQPQMLRYANAICAERLWANGYVLVGDSAMFVDPLFSTGVHAALYSAAQAAAALLSMLDEDVAEELAAAFYEQRMRQHYRRIDATVRVLYSMHRGTKPFWQKRNLDGVSTEEAETIARDLGVAGMRFFQGALQSAELTLPPPLSQCALSFITEVRPREMPESAILGLGRDVAVSACWTEQGGRLTPGVAAAHAGQRTVTVEYPRHSPEAAMLLAVDARTSLSAINDGISRSPRHRWRTRWLAGTLVESGLLRRVA